MRWLCTALFAVRKKTALWAVLILVLLGRSNAIRPYALRVGGWPDSIYANDRVLFAVLLPHKFQCGICAFTHFEPRRLMFFAVF